MRLDDATSVAQYKTLHSWRYTRPNFYRLRHISLNYYGLLFNSVCKKGGIQCVLDSMQRMHHQ